eukprot:13074405-Ditylum_brightwellii.AAC.1
MEELMDKDHELVLLLDVNEDITEDGDFKSFIDENDLIDVYKHLHLESHPVTYLRGNKQLDYVCITPGLIPALRAAGYLPFHTGIFSDHSALFVDSDEEMKQAFQQMKPITKGVTGGVVRELLVPNPDALSCPATYDE